MTQSRFDVSRAVIAWARTGILISSAFALSGCAYLTHYNTSDESDLKKDEARTTFIDAKQRAVIMTKADNGNLRICAEPSPDALSAIAASGGIGLTARDIELSQAMSLAETSGSMGLRTQSIQLMRDEMYRACEMYLSGAIDKFSWEMLHRRSQNLMVAVLAIEQLTGTVKAKQVSLSTDAGSGSAELVSKLTGETEAARQKLREAEATLPGLQAAATAAQSDAEAKKKLANAATGDAKLTLTGEYEVLQKAADQKKTEVTDTEKTIAERKANYEYADKARKAALNGDTRASATAAMDGGESPAAKETKVLSASVAMIVNGALGQSYGQEICATVISQRLNVDVPEPSDDPKALNAQTRNLQELTAFNDARKKYAADKKTDVLNVRETIIGKCLELMDDSQTSLATAQRAAGIALAGQTVPEIAAPVKPPVTTGP